MSADVDLDFADRKKILDLIKHVPARKLHQGTPERHASGVYVQPIPYDPAIGASALHYKDADKRGYFKLDMLNVSVYAEIKSPEHYEQLLKMTIPWHKLKNPEFVQKIVHISNYSSDLLHKDVNSIPRMAMFLAAIRPAKKHLLHRSWAEISTSIWDKVDGEYSFKRSHAVAYSMLVTLHMRIVHQQEMQSK